MPITESKLKQGVLTLGGAAFECQAVNVKLTPTHNTTSAADDVVETLCGDTTTPDGDETITTTWTLNIEAIQDFTVPDGFVRHTITHNQEIQPFTWKPNTGGPTFTGQVRILATEIGGEINKRITTSAAFPVIGAVSTAAPTSAEPFTISEEVGA